MIEKGVCDNEKTCCDIEGNPSHYFKCSACGYMLWFKDAEKTSEVNFCPNCGRKVVDDFEYNRAYHQKLYDEIMSKEAENE